jgi:ABC-type nitrate/sulfonate/bicarbonate transport system substrate-binding protein
MLLLGCPTGFMGVPHRRAYLAGRRLALPVWPKVAFNFLRFAAEKGFHSALKVHGLSEHDVTFVDVINEDDMRSLINPDFAEGKRKRSLQSYYSAEIQALVRGEVDAIFLRGVEVSQAEREANGQVRRLYDLRNAPGLAERVNNSSPRLLTVSGSLVRTHPEAVVRYVQTLVHAALWARNHPVEAQLSLAAECGVQPEDIARSYQRDIAKRLLPMITPELIEAAEIMKSFLYERGYIPKDFPLAAWLNPEPLQEAYSRECREDVVSSNPSPTPSA